MPEDPRRVTLRRAAVLLEVGARLLQSTLDRAKRQESIAFAPAGVDAAGEPLPGGKIVAGRSCDAATIKILQETIENHFKIARELRDLWNQLDPAMLPRVDDPAVVEASKNWHGPATYIEAPATCGSCGARFDPAKSAAVPLRCLRCGSPSVKKDEPTKPGRPPEPKPPACVVPLPPGDKP